MRAVGCDDHTGRKNNASDEIVPAVRDISGFENTPVIYIYRVVYREETRAKKSFPPTRPVFTINRAYEIQMAKRTRFSLSSFLPSSPDCLVTRYGASVAPFTLIINRKLSAMDE